MTRVFSLLACLAFVGPALGQPRTDIYGDALPEGAIARFGTVRYRFTSAEQVYAWALSPDGKRLAMLHGRRLGLWDLDSGRRLWSLDDAPTWGPGLAFSPEGKTLIALSGLEVKLLDPETGNERHALELRLEGRAVAFRPGTTEFVVTVGDESAPVFDAAAPAQVDTVEADEPVRILSPSGRRFLGRSDSTLYLVDAGTGRLRCRFAVDLDPDLDDYVADPSAQRCALSLDDRRLYLVTARGELLEFDARTGRTLQAHDPPAGWEREERSPRVALSPDGGVLYVSYPGGPTRRRDVRAGKWLAPLPVVAPGPLVPHPDRKHLMVLGSDGVIRRYNLATLREVGGPPGFDTDVLVAAAPDGRRVAITSGAGAGRLDLFDTGGKWLWSAPVRGEPGQPRWSADGRRVACAGRSEVIICDAATGKALRAVPNPDPVRRFTGLIGFDGARDRVVAALDNGGAILTVPFHAGGRPEVMETAVTWVADVSPDGRTVAFDNGGPSVALFDVATRDFRIGWTFPPPPPRGCGGGGVRADPPSTRFAPDGSFVTSWFDEGAIVLWDPVTGEAERVIQTGLDGFGHQAFSPDGLWLATASGSQVSLWDLATGQHLVTRELAHDAGITSISFAGPGRLLSTSGDLTALLWDVGPKKKPIGPLWDALAGDNARAAYQAAWALAAEPRGPDILRTRIAPARPAPPERVQRWLAYLGSDDYKAREMATRELHDLGRLVEPELRAALAKTTSEEVRTRLERLLVQIPRIRTGDEWVQARAVLALELAGTEAAKKALREWAAGAPGARLTIDAKAALGRLAATR